jgi:hypothetical protein
MPTRFPEMHAEPVNITVKTLAGLPGPHNVGWVDDMLSALNRSAEVTGSLIARPLIDGEGMMVAFGAHLPDGSPFTLVKRMHGTGSRARYAQFTRFSGKDAEWTAAFDRAGEERVLPAVKAIPGWTETFVCRSDDGTTLTITLGESVETLQNCTTAIMNTKLLEWENPEHLTGPDDVKLLQLMHVELPS